MPRASSRNKTSVINELNSRERENFKIINPSATKNLKQRCASVIIYQGEIPISPIRKLLLGKVKLIQTCLCAVVDEEVGLNSGALLIGH